VGSTPSLPARGCRRMGRDWENLQVA
jgi:hypothetical protein